MLKKAMALRDELEKLFGDVDFRVIPQNIEKESTPAKILREENLPAETIQWVVPANGEGWLGCLVKANAAHKNPVLGSWAASLVFRALSVREIGEYYAFKLNAPRPQHAEPEPDAKPDPEVPF